MNRVELVTTLLDFGARYLAAGDAELAAACKRVAADVAREVPGAPLIDGADATCRCGAAFRKTHPRQVWCSQGCSLGEEKRRRDGAPESLAPVYRALGRFKAAIWEREEQLQDGLHRAGGGGSR